MLLFKLGLDILARTDYPVQTRRQMDETNIEKDYEPFMKAAEEALATLRRLMDTAPTRVSMEWVLKTIGDFQVEFTYNPTEDDWNMLLYSVSNWIEALMVQVAAAHHKVTFYRVGNGVPWP